MSKKKVLIVTQEMQPYTALSEIAAIVKSRRDEIERNIRVRNMNVSNFAILTAFCMLALLAEEYSDLTKWF